MNVTGAARLFCYRTLWRATRWRPAGRGLVRALGSEDEDLRTMAGMFLVQAGKRAEPLLEEAMRRREHLPLVLRILGDVGDCKFEPELQQLSHDRDPEVAHAARDALLVLAARQRPGSST